MPSPKKFIKPANGICKNFIKPSATAAGFPFRRNLLDNALKGIRVICSTLTTLKPFRSTKALKPSPVKKLTCSGTHKQALSLVPSSLTKNES